MLMVLTCHMVIDGLDIPKRMMTGGERPIRYERMRLANCGWDNKSAMCALMLVTAAADPFQTSAMLVMCFRFRSLMQVTARLTCFLVQSEAPHDILTATQGERWS